MPDIDPSAEASREARDPFAPQADWGSFGADDAPALMRAAALLADVCAGQDVIVIGDETGLLSASLATGAASVRVIAWSGAGAMSVAGEFLRPNLRRADPWSLELFALRRACDVAILVDTGATRAWMERYLLAHRALLKDGGVFALLRCEPSHSAPARAGGDNVRELFESEAPACRAFEYLYPEIGHPPGRALAAGGFAGFRIVTGAHGLSPIPPHTRRMSLFVSGPETRLAARWGGILGADARDEAIPQAEAAHALAGREAEIRRLGTERRRLMSALRERDRRIQDSEAETAAARADGAARLEALHSSTSWRLTAPLRWVARVLKGEPAKAPKAEAPGEMPPVKSALSRQRERALYQRQASTAGLAPAVLIVAELSLAQCAKYRVWQKRDAIAALGVRCTVLSWADAPAVRNALQTHTHVIFYRAPGFDEVVALIEEAKRLGLDVRWEVDDLIFDKDAYLANKNLETLSKEVQDSILFGVPYYLRALKAAGRGLASTRVLGERMQAMGIENVAVIENALDAETLATAEAVLAEGVHRSRGGEVVIFYGSGSRAHDADFACAADALAEVLAERPQARLVIAGHLTLPEALKAYEERIERPPFEGFTAYLRRLAQADISLAPLEDTVFNDAKSNIKFLEAAVMNVASVCSPRTAFKDAIEDGVTARLAETPAQWRKALLTLIDDAGARADIAAAARRMVLSRYGPDHIRRHQVAPLLPAGPAPRRGLRILTVNVFFKPQSFGGATIVAEEVAKLMHGRPDTEVFVFTSWGDDEARAYDLQRYEVDGMSVFAVRMPHADPRDLEFENEKMRAVFAEALRAASPDIVHFHSIQGLSASLLDACLDADVPYAVTLHDAWWICERQFMVTGAQRYCFQREISLSVCATCVDDIDWSVRRASALRARLERAQLLMSPSAFHRDLHVANGFAPESVVVNRNGVSLPGAGYSRSRAEHLRFAFVGGRGPIKGLELIKEAFVGLSRADYELILVDNTLNLGLSSIDPKDWSLPGKVTIAPAYTQAELDEFFGGVDVLLFPSQWKESFGLTVREALARDVWVVATDSGGAVEDIVDGENGTIIPIGADVTPLRAAISALLDDAERVKAHTNRHKGRIVGFAQQADETVALLRSAHGAWAARRAPKTAALETEPME